MSISAEYNNYHNLRERLQDSVNSFPRNAISFEIFKKDAAERENLKIAKARFRELKKNHSLYNDSKGEILDRIIKSSVPEWGNIDLRLI